MTLALKKSMTPNIQQVRGISLAPPIRDFEMVQAHADKIILSPLKLLREQKGLSQKQLATRIGMERTRLLRLERKTWGEMSVGDIELISSALGMRLPEVLARFSGFGR